MGSEPRAHSAHKGRHRHPRNPRRGETGSVPTGAHSQGYPRALARGLGIQNLWDLVESEEGMDRRAPYFFLLMEKISFLKSKEKRKELQKLA